MSAGWPTASPRGPGGCPRCYHRRGQVIAVGQQLRYLARRANSSPEMAAKLKDQIASAKADLAESKRWLAEHQAECEQVSA